MDAIGSVVSAAAELMRSHVLPTVLGGAILAALTIGGSYLLFQEKPELQQLKDRGKNYSEIYDSKLQISEQMDHILVHGWFNSNNETKLSNILLQLVQDRTKPSLDPVSMRNYLNWINKSISQLKEESGRIQGFSFRNDSLERKHQSITLKQYDAVIRLLQLMNETIIKWDRDPDNQRAIILITVFPSFEDIIQEMDASEINESQIRANLERNWKNYTTFFYAERDDLRAWRLKSIIALICVFTSVLVMLLGLGALSLNYFRPPRRRDRLPRPTERRPTPPRRRHE